MGGEKLDPQPAGSYAFFTGYGWGFDLTRGADQGAVGGEKMAHPAFDFGIVGGNERDDGRQRHAPVGLAATDELIADRCRWNWRVGRVLRR